MLKLQNLCPPDEKNWLWKRFWCWERLKAGGEGDDRRWDAWMALATQWPWVWARSTRWWSTGKPAAAAAKSLQSCPTLCDAIDGSPLGSPVPGILQARTLEWVVISFSNAWKWKVKSETEVAQSCPTLCDPMDCSLPGSSIHGIFQAREYWSGVPLPSLKHIHYPV